MKSISEQEYLSALAVLEHAKKSQVHLNMARGKPSQAQIELANPMLETLRDGSDFLDSDGNDVRNYGLLEGISECRELMGQVLGVSKDNVIIYGNSSLHVMYEQISRSMTHGVLGSVPWSKLDKVKWLCPVPGYDRHFSILEFFGIEMINVPMNEFGPDMDLIEELIQDESVKGIWCVPQYSNPTGITYSNEVVRRFARLDPKAKDFRIYWDNAYAVHHLHRDKQDHLLNIFDEALKVGNEDIVYMFASTSKVSFPGAGIAALAASTPNLSQIKKQMGVSTIGYDKINQLRHVRFFHDLDGLKRHIHRLSDIMLPKFELVERVFDERLSGLDGVCWTKPNGGYFISLNVPGKAKQVIERCRECGVVLTPAGATYPYHRDPDNANIRIAPTYPDLKELAEAAEVLCAAIIVEMH